jgi:ribosomal protein S27AE
MKKYQEYRRCSCGTVYIISRRSQRYRCKRCHETAMQRERRELRKERDNG